MRSSLGIPVGAIALVIASPMAVSQQETGAPMTFFVTSQTNSGNLGGLAGADDERVEHGRLTLTRIRYAAM